MASGGKPGAIGMAQYLAMVQRLAIAESQRLATTSAISQHIGLATTLGKRTILLVEIRKGLAIAATLDLGRLKVRCHRTIGGIAILLAAHNHEGKG